MHDQKTILHQLKKKISKTHKKRIKHSNHAIRKNTQITVSCMESPKSKSKSICIWANHLDQASRIANVELSPVASAYIATILNQHMIDMTWSHTPIGMNWLEPTHSEYECLHQQRRIGNQCVVVCGIFPEIATHFNTTVTHYISIGQSAYYFIATQEETPLEDQALFGELSDKFIDITQVLAHLKSPPYQIRK
jgi:hypothetical protein